MTWTLYLMLNSNVDIMNNAFQRTLLFLSFIKGPNVYEWVTIQTTWLGRRIQRGTNPGEEYLYDTVMQAFENAFTDTMSTQRARAEF